MTHDDSRTRRFRSLTQLIWDEFGGWGRTALVAVVLAMATVAAVGIAIERAARDDLLDARADLLSQVAAGLDVAAVIDDPTLGNLARFDENIRYRLLGGETVRVKLWNEDGVVVYSDVSSLIGRRFDLGPDAREAFVGVPSIDMADVDGPDNPENLFERDLGELIEFYLPVFDQGRVVGVFEIYQSATSLEDSLARIRRDVWSAILLGVGMLGLFVGSLIVANVHVINRRRRQAEAMSDELMRATEAERARIVEAMHDDIGQPLYRVLYGLQGARARLDDPVIVDELARLEAMVREVDGALRSELRLLNRAALQEVGLVSAVRDLVDATQAETDLTVDASIGELPTLTSGAEAALFRAVQESLFNVRKHAGGGVSVDVRMSATPNRVYASVMDDGRGWDGAEGLGLATTRRGLEAIGGGLTIAVRPDGGTVVNAWVPVVREEMLV